MQLFKCKELSTKVNKLRKVNTRIGSLGGTNNELSTRQTSRMHLLWLNQKPTPTY